MPRVHHVKSARKDNPVAKVGESYYWWEFRFGGKKFSRTPPRRSQLTQSEKLGRAYELAERMDDIPLDTDFDHDSLKEAVENFVSILESITQDIQELAGEYRESAENIRASFSESPTADDCEEKAEELDGWVIEIESASSELESIEFDSDDFDLESAVSTYFSAVENSNSCPL